MADSSTPTQDLPSLIQNLLATPEAQSIGSHPQLQGMVADGTLASTLHDVANKMQAAVGSGVDVMPTNEKAALEQADPTPSKAASTPANNSDAAQLAELIAKSGGDPNATAPTTTQEPPPRIGLMDTLKGIVGMARDEVLREVNKVKGNK